MQMQMNKAIIFSILIMPLTIKENRGKLDCVMTGQEIAEAREYLQEHWNYLVRNISKVTCGAAMEHNTNDTN